MRGCTARARSRVFVDVAAAAVGSAGIGSALIAATDGSPLVDAVALAAGLTLVGVVAWSVVRRRPVFCTPADRVTLLRAVLVGGCATVVVLGLVDAVASRSWWLFLLAAPALLLDAVDGWVARRTGTASAQGARLDMEIDAVFLVVLTIPLAFTLGPWVLAIGAIRYVFVAASWWRPALRQPLRFSTFRRVTAGVQGVVLVLALIPTVPGRLAAPVTAVALALLVFSFTRDVLGLERAFTLRRSDAAAGVDVPAARQATRLR